MPFCDHGVLVDYSGIDNVIVAECQFPGCNWKEYGYALDVCSAIMHHLKSHHNRPNVKVTG
jgi:hypothetical protein